MSHVRLEGKTDDNVHGSYVLDKKRNSSRAGFNVFIIISIFLFITNVFLALYLFWFDSSTEDSRDNEYLSSVLSGLNEDSHGDQYLTGSVAPNMLFLLADDMGWSDISANGALYETPNIDELVTGGIQYTDFHTHDLCTPTRVAFLTGRFVWRTGLQYPHVVKGLYTGHIPMDEKTFAEVTKEMGYDNYYVGRWGVGYASWNYTALGRGWDKFLGYFGPEEGYYNHTAGQGEWWNVYDFFDMKEPGWRYNGTYSEDIFLKRTLEHFEEAQNKGKPFTLVYGSQTAHSPIDEDWPSAYPPITWEECEEENTEYWGRELYCNKVKYLDYIWGIILDYLKETGMWDNMLIFTTSDNGGTPYTGTDWYGWGCNWPLRGGKSTYFEGGIKNWFGMTGGLVPSEYKGTTFDSLTHITDIAATAMRLSMTQSEFKARKSLTGTSKVVDGKNLFAFEHHELIVHNVIPYILPSVASWGEFDYAATDGEWKYIVGVWDETGFGTGWYNAPGYGIIDKHHEPEAFGEAGGNCSDGCLFHITTDPSEQHDLAMEYSEITVYFALLIDAIYRGGFDDSYHPGQPFEPDYRGWQEDDVVRPYLNPDAVEDYQKRLSSITNNDNYDYQSFSQFWFGDYEGEGDPFI